MIRAGLIRQVVAGAYTYLPLGYRSLRKIEAIVRDEMNRAGAIERSVRIFSVLTGPAYPLDEARCRELSACSLDRAPSNPAGFKRQMAAILASGNRVKALSALDLPTLVIHGTDDPLIPIAAGEATARTIPGARLQRIEGMGHQMPAAFWPVLADAVAEHALSTATEASAS